MAYVNSTRSTHVSFLDRFAAVVKIVKDAVERRRVYNETLFELSNLSDRDLADLGLSRASISDVAKAAAYNQ